MYDFFYRDKTIKEECISVLKKDKIIIIDDGEYIIQDVKFDIDTNNFYCEVYPNYVYKLKLKE